MDSIKDKTVTIRVNQTGSGLRTAQHGMHEVLAQDTLIQAHGGERVDIDRGGGGGQTRSSGGGGGGGSGGGDNFFFNIHFGDREIVKRVKAELGRSVYTMGA